jgi:para-nitrobenzyl esterase
MRHLIAGLAGLSLTFAGAVACAQPTTPPPPAPAAPQVAASPGKASVETTTIADLLASPGAKAVLQKDFPELIAYPGIDQIKGMTLRDISKFPQAQLDDARLATIQSDLNTAPN